MNFVLLVVLLLLMLAWPVSAVAGLVLVVLALRARGRRRVGWSLSGAALCAAFAAYGYGLKSTTSGRGRTPMTGAGWPGRTSTPTVTAVRRVGR